MCRCVCSDWETITRDVNKIFIYFFIYSVLSVLRLRSCDALDFLPKLFWHIQPKYTQAYTNILTRRRKRRMATTGSGDGEDGGDTMRWMDNERALTKKSWEFSSTQNNQHMGYPSHFKRITFHTSILRLHHSKTKNKMKTNKPFSSGTQVIPSHSLFGESFIHDSFARCVCVCVGYCTSISLCCALCEWHCYSRNACCWASPVTYDPFSAYFSYEFLPLFLFLRAQLFLFFLSTFPNCVCVCFVKIGFLHSVVYAVV